MRPGLIGAWLIAGLAVFAAAPARLKESQLDAIRAQRIEWMKKRVSRPPLGIYRDFRAAMTHTAVPRTDLLNAAQAAAAQIVFAEGVEGVSRGVLFLPLPGHDFPGVEIYRRAEEDGDAWRKLRGLFHEYPDDVLGAGTDLDSDAIAGWDQATIARRTTGFAFSDNPAPPVVSLAAVFRNTSTHILARELTASGVGAGLTGGHVYVAHDWLCDPTGFAFFAANNLGVFDIGDTVPMGLIAGRTELQAFFPVAAKIKLIRNGVEMATAEDFRFSFGVKDAGVYRIEAWLSAGGKDHPWILSNPIYVQGSADLRIPSVDTSSSVEVHSGITYVEGDPVDNAKHKLDLYLPRGKSNYPILFFVHGGSWRTGDRSTYAPLGSYFAARGIGVAIPSYRLMPEHPHPAQIEDVATAFAWVYHRRGDFGGDARRIYLAGHSAGGHLVSLLALDRHYLDKRDVPATAVRGVISMSGVYDVRETTAFTFQGNKAEASPEQYVTAGAPPFLITYCQWDYLGLPKQARDFAAGLRKAFDDVQVEYISGETHISEIISAVRDDTPLSRAILNFIE